MEAKNIRKELTRIVEENENDWWKPEGFEKKVRPLLPKTLDIVAPPPKHEDNYNCLVFAFGLQDDPDFLGGNNPIQGNFIKYSILKGNLIPADQPAPGDLIFYENKSGEITHGGIIKSKDQIISKWMWGPTVIHKTMDVQSTFGDELLYFKPLAPSRVKELYQEYKDTGVEIKPIG